VRVNALVLGPIETPQLRALFENIGDDEIARRFVHYPMGRFGTLEELAGTVAYLASDDAGFITGAAFPLDGGITSALRFRPERRQAIRPGSRSALAGRRRKRVTTTTGLCARSDMKPVLAKLAADAGPRREAEHECAAGRGGCRVKVVLSGRFKRLPGCLRTS
jgi:hypothetical protein